MPRRRSSTRRRATSRLRPAIFLDSFGKSWAIFALIIVMGAQFFCGMASITTNSRMIYAFSRDGAVPGHRWWHSINKRTRTPTNAIWLAAVLAWLLVAPAYWLGSIVGVLRGDGRRRHRPLHRLRDPDLPAAPSGR